MSSSFIVNYPVGGNIDRVRQVDSIANPVQVIVVNSLNPEYQHPFLKGFRLELPASDPTNPAIYPIEYIVNRNMELLSIEVGCTGYMDTDFWSFYINGRPICETIYTKEVAQVKSLGVIKLTAGDVLRFEFQNTSGTSKVVWVDMNFTSQE